MIDSGKIIIGTVGGGRYTVTAPIIKEDYGLYLKIEGLELPATYEVDFSNSEHNGTAVTMIGNSDGVLIPSQFIKSGKDVFAFLYHVGVDFGRTIYKFRIPNKLRPDRTDEQPTPEEQSTIDQAISALNSAVEQTAQDVVDADASAQSASESAEQAEDASNSAMDYAERARQLAINASESASQASASATASAQSASQSAQIKADVEDLADDAQASASASANSASQANASASQASNYADDARGHANTAHGYATDASNSADTATTKASEASGHAQTASQKATEASGYADTSSQKASESAQSASLALGYKNDAEQAKTDAETAQSKAEDAQAAAESVAESIPSDYSQLSADVSQIKEGLNALPKLLNSDADDVDLDLTDADGNVILRLADGHIKTKEFDSSNLPDDSPVAVRKSDAQDADLDITDLAGNVLVRVADGEIQSANFNSAVDTRHWTGKKWTAIGDSLTEVNQRTTKHYHDYIAEATGINVVNLGHSGAGYYARPSDFTFRRRALQVETDSDVVTIFGSGNDVGKISLGEVTDTDATTLCGCINITLDNIYATAPLVPLGVITPTPWYQQSGSKNWTPSNPDNDMELYSNAIVEICRRRSIPCLDLYHCSNLHPDIESFRTIQYSKDDGNGIHPDETGHYLIAARFQAFLETLLMH